MATDNPNADVTPEPVWDGQGDDPWLPERVNRQLNALAAEQSIYAAVWEALSKWLVGTTRRVLSTPIPQPDAIFAEQPAWNRWVDDIITTAIMPVMSWAYKGLWGPDYHWQDRPNVIGYLAGVHNRLVRTPDHVFNLVASELAAGVTMGESIPDLADRVDEVLSTTDSPRWQNRATVIARTETMGALNGSRTDAFQAWDEETEEELERVWLSTMDSRTRPSHVLADGQRASMVDPFIVGGFPLMFPGDPQGPAQEVIQCRCTTLLVEKGEFVNMADRQMRR